MDVPRHYGRRLADWPPGVLSLYVKEAILGEWEKFFRV